MKPRARGGKEIIYRGRKCRKVRDEWGLWKDLTRPDWYLIYCRPAGTAGPCMRQWRWTGGDYTHKELLDEVRQLHSQVRARAENRPVPMRPVEAIESYIDSLHRRNLSADHIEGSRLSLDKFARIMEISKLNQLTAPLIERFLSTLRSGGRTARTHNLYRSHLSGWCRWLVSSGILPDNPVRKIRSAKEPRRLAKFPSFDDLVTIVEASTPYTAAIWYWFAFTGLRRASVLSITLECFRREGIFIPHTKRGEEWLIRYDSKCPLWGPDLHLRLVGERIWRQERPTDAALDRYRSQVVASTGLHYTPHAYRHAFGSWLALLGANLNDIQAWMHHATARTTERYKHLQPNGDEEKRRNSARLRTIRAQCLDHILGPDHKSLLDSELRKWRKN